MRLLPLACALLLTLSNAPPTHAESPTAKPHHAAVEPTPRDDDIWQARFEALNELPQRDTAQLVFLGDSITDGWDDVGKEVWQEYYKRRHALNLGIGGDRTEHVLWRLKHGHFKKLSPQLVVLLIGTNNLAQPEQNAQQTIDGITAVVDQLKAELPQTSILLLGIFPRGAAVDDAFRLQVAAVNRVVSQMADWQQVHFLDIGHVFLDSDQSISAEIMPDSLHLSPSGYRRWAEAMEWKVAELMHENSQQRQSLFDGQSLDGWKAGDEGGKPNGWDVVDGSLAIVGRGDDAQTVKLFRNFDFQCEWKVERRSNSGIFYRWADYAGIVSAGPEYQIIDELGRKMPPDLKNSLAATTDMYEPLDAKPTREPGRWNHTRIVAVDGDVEHWLNGMRVVTFDITSDEWARRLKKSKFRRLWPFGRLYEGAFRLQNYGGMPVYYRDISVVEL